MNRRWIYRATGEDVRQLGGFDVVLADPAWKYKVQGGRGAADKHYRTLPLPELCLLPVEHLASPDALLFLWAVWPMLFDAGALMRAWGFEYLNCGFVWVKTNKAQPTPFMGLGHWTRGNTELCLVGRRGKPTRVSAAVEQVLLTDNLLVAPVADHSEKPAEIRDRIMQLVGDVPAIELFAREQASGWECWGDEVESTVTLEWRGDDEEDQVGGEGSSREGDRGAGSRSSAGGQAAPAAPASVQQAGGGSAA